MVLSGLMLQRFLPRAALMLVVLGWTHVGRGQVSDVAGTMPEDYLPELKKILTTALQRSPNVIEPLLLIELREAGRIAANAARLPSLGSNISYGSTELSESGSSTNRSRDNGLFYNFGLNQALFHWGALKNQTAIANINALLAGKNFEKAYRELSVLLRQSYLQLIVNKARLRHARDSLQLNRKAIEVAKERLQRGVASSADLAGEELRTRELALEVNRAEADLITGRRTFSRIAGIPELAEQSIPDDIPKPIYSAALATALSSALLRDGAKGTIEAQMHELRLREATLRYQIERVRLYPKVNAGAGYSLENTTTVGTSVGQRAVARQTLSVTANWAIFDGFATRAAKMEAKSIQRAVAARRDAEMNVLLDEVQALHRQLTLDVEQLELAEIRRAMAIETRRRAAEEVGFGNLSPGEVDRAETGIRFADAKLLEARAALLGRWSQFVAIAGEDPGLNNLPVRYERAKK